jgi:aminoglycoside/choline kinase family phosphotransferase
MDQTPIDITSLRALAHAAGLDVAPAPTPSPMAGGASPRLWWRFTTPDGRPIVAMIAPVDHTPSEHGAGSDDPLERWVAVGERLGAAGLPVPTVHGIARTVDGGACSAVFIDDLGDRRLFECLSDQTPSARLASYRGATALLARFQQVTSDWTTSAVFNAAAMSAELDEFRRMGLEARHGIVLSSNDRDAWDRFAAHIVSRLDALPRVFSHRDFQSQNLMWPASGPVIIDFQDAFMAPAAYDWVALLRDSYIDLAPADVRALLADASPHVRETFHLQTVQRKLKDAGRFVTLAGRGKPWFLQWYPRTIGFVMAALAELPEYASIASMLARIIPEARAEPGSQ